MTKGNKNVLRLISMMMVLILVLGSVFAAGQKETAAVAGEKKVIVMNAASMFDETHPFTQTLIKFEELVNEYQDEVTFELKMNLNKALGIESDYLRFMSQGESVDIAIIAPAHIAQKVPSIAILDMPLLFRDINHRNAVLESHGQGQQGHAEAALVVAHAPSGKRARKLLFILMMVK